MATLAGISLVIACGCVINNCIDRGIDARMARTRRRALVTGQVRPGQAVIYGSSLGLAGFAVLLAYVNILTAIIGGIGLFFYLVMYGVWKRRSPLGTVVGSVSGAAPITGGYTAVTGHFDAAAFILFLTMVLWQMPHFYAIAMYRLKDYRAAGLPVLPTVKGSQRTKLQIIAYVMAFSVSALMLSAYGYTGYTYAVVMAALGLIWLRKGLRGFTATDDNQWGRQMFGFSLIVLLAFSLALSVGALLP